MPKLQAFFDLIGRIRMNMKVTERLISESIRFVCILVLGTTLWITKQAGVVFWGVGLIVSLVAVFFSPGYILNKIVFNYFKKQHYQKKDK
jgi:type IV secretory pathway TrbD component